MTTDTVTITDFILARVAEDEAAASPTVAEMNANNPNAGCQLGPAIAYFPPEALPKGSWGRFRVLAECKAKRAIVAIHDGGYIKNVGPLTHECDGSYDSIVCETLTALAAVYAGHEDYRAEWSL